MRDVRELIVTVQLNLRPQITVRDVTCTIEDRIHRVLDALEQQDKGDDRQDDHNDQRDDRNHLNP